MNSNVSARYARLTAEPLGTVGVADGKISVGSSLKELFKKRALLGHLVRRDLKARYKDSVLGVFWSLVRPLTQLMIYYLVLGKFLGAERGIPDFAIYIFVGLTAYGLFAEIVTVGTSSVVDNSGLVKKTYFPREILPLSAVFSALVNFGVQLIVLIGAMVVLQSFPNIQNLWYLLPATLLVILIATAAALFFSAVNVYFRDVKYLVEVITMILMWLSPVVYSWKMVYGIVGEGILLTLYTYNPLTIAVLGFQKALWGGGTDPALYPESLGLILWIECLVALVLVALAYMGFRKWQGNFAQAL